MEAPRVLDVAAAVERNAPVVALGGAILIDLPSLIAMFHNAVSATTALERLVLSYVFALIASRLLAALFVRYAEDAARRAEEQAASEVEG